MVLSSCYAVDNVFRWLLASCFAVAVAWELLGVLLFLGCSEWLIGCCFGVAGVFRLLFMDNL